MQFCIILTLNNAYYQVREAETQAFYELFRAELQAASLDNMLRRFLRTLRRFCHAEDGRMMLFDPEQPPSPRLLPSRNSFPAASRPTP